MGKIIKLTESDLTRIVRRIIKEQSTVTPKLEEFVGKTAKFVTDDKSQMKPFRIVRTKPNSKQNDKAIFDVEIIDANGDTIKPASITMLCSTKKLFMYSPGDSKETSGFSPKLADAIATKWCVPETVSTDY
jgi:hypothetical protein